MIKLDWDYLESNLVCVLFLETVFPAGDCVSRGIVTLGKTVGSTNLGGKKANIIASRLIFAVPNNIVNPLNTATSSPKKYHTLKIGMNVKVGFIVLSFTLCVGSSWKFWKILQMQFSQG